MTIARADPQRRKVLACGMRTCRFQEHLRLLDP
jgi:hypothetical protein